MDILSKNPFRIIGVLGNSGAKELAKQRSKISAFQKVGKDLAFEEDISLGKPIIRSETEIDGAFSSILQSKNRVHFSLFWFVDISHLDHLALDYLKKNDFQKAEEIWTKAIHSRPVSSENFSAYNNLGSLRIALSEASSQGDAEQLADGLILKKELILSPYFPLFCQAVADETFRSDGNIVLESVVKTTVEQAGKKSKEYQRSLLQLLIPKDPVFKSVLASQFADVAISAIERKIESCAKSRKERPRKGLQLGSDLYKNVKPEISDLEVLLGKADLRFEKVSELFAKELLQCGIDFFQAFRDDEKDCPGDLGSDVMKLFLKAQSQKVGSQTRQRISENVSGLQEWIDSSHEREQEKAIAEDIAFITAQLKRFEGKSNTNDNADDLIIKCSARLRNIRSQLGATNDLYLRISTAVASHAQGMLVNVVNSAQRRFSNHYITLLDLQSSVIYALRISERIGKMDMLPEMRNHHRKNHQTLQSISSQVNVATRMNSTHSSSNSDGCFIATMAYGSYEHPQVLKLRQFRDDKLSQSWLGRFFIQAYYSCSPHLVQLLKGHERINKLIRNALDGLIKQME